MLNIRIGDKITIEAEVTGVGSNKVQYRPPNASSSYFWIPRDEILAISYREWKLDDVCYYTCPQSNREFRCRIVAMEAGQIWIKDIKNEEKDCHSINRLVSAAELWHEPKKPLDKVE